MIPKVLEDFISETEIPLGLILCAETSSEQVELLEMHTNIMVRNHEDRRTRKTEKT